MWQRHPYGEGLKRRAETATRAFPGSHVARVRQRSPWRSPSCRLWARPVRPPPSRPRRTVPLPPIRAEQRASTCLPTACLPTAYRSTRADPNRRPRKSGSTRSRSARGRRAGRRACRPRAAGARTDRPRTCCASTCGRSGGYRCSAPRRRWSSPNGWRRASSPRSGCAAASRPTPNSPWISTDWWCAAGWPSEDSSSPTCASWSRSPSGTWAAD